MYLNLSYTGWKNHYMTHKKIHCAIFDIGSVIEGRSIIPWNAAYVY